MDNKEYWSQRFISIENIEHDTAKVTTSDIQSLLATACSQIDKEINAFYQKYADETGMTLADAQLFLQQNDLLAFKADVKAYTKMALNNTDGQFSDLLDALSTRARIQRLDALKIRAAMAIREAYGKADAELTKTCESIMQDARLRSAYEIQHGIGKYEPFQQLDKKALAAAIKKPWSADGQTFSDRIWNHQTNLVNTLQKQFVQGFIQGINPKEMTDNLVNDFGVAERAAARLVRTEGAAFAAEGDKSTYTNFGIEKFQILGTLDNVTCSECEDMDGQIIDMKDYSIGDTVPPYHANCRCTTIPYIDDDVMQKDETRATRDDNGNTVMVDGGLNYHEWFDKYVKGDGADEG